MLLSMTGFGRGEACCSDGSKITIAIASVNRKQLEMRFSLPAELSALEIAGRKLVSQAVSRGSLQIRCTVCDAAAQAGNFEVNTALLDKLIKESRAARVRANMSAEVAVETLIAVPGVLSNRKESAETPELQQAFENALLAALDDFNNMRRVEGKALADDLLQRIEKLEAWHGELSQMTAAYPELAKDRIMNRLANSNLPVSADDPALLREVLFYVDKGDVTEELTRLSSHFTQFRSFLASETPSGRNMDFLAQEIFREITTLGNKAAVGGASPVVVAFKAEMEKIREQIQNIE